MTAQRAFRSNGHRAYERLGWVKPSQVFLLLFTTKKKSSFVSFDESKRKGGGVGWQKEQGEKDLVDTL